MTASPTSSTAHYAKAQALRAQGRYEEAIPEYERAVASNRNSVNALAHIGRCKISMGMLDEAIALQEQAIRLSPRDPLIGQWYNYIGLVHLLQSHPGEAIFWCEKARSANPELATHGYLASAYALKGETGRAAAELAEARRLNRDGRYLSIALAKAHATGAGHIGPKVRALYETTYFAGLRKAGMPEE